MWDGTSRELQATYLLLTRGLLHCTICCLWWLALFTVHIIIDSKWRRRLFIVCMAALLHRAVWARDTTPHTATPTVQQGHYTTHNHCHRTTGTLHYRQPLPPYNRDNHATVQQRHYTTHTHCHRTTGTLHYRQPLPPYNRNTTLHIATATVQQRHYRQPLPPYNRDTTDSHCHCTPETLQIAIATVQQRHYRQPLPLYNRDTTLQIAIATVQQRHYRQPLPPYNRDTTDSHCHRTTDTTAKR